jgi:hypothetical protein
MIGSTVMINPLTPTVLGFAFPAGLSSAAFHEDGRVESGRVLIAERSNVRLSEDAHCSVEGD